MSPERGASSQGFHRQEGDLEASPDPRPRSRADHLVARALRSSDASRSVEVLAATRSPLCHATQSSQTIVTSLIWDSVRECHPSASLVPAGFVCITGLADAQCFVGWEELVPAGLDVAELATADVVGKMLDVNLDT